MWMRWTADQREQQPAARTSGAALQGGLLKQPLPNTSGACFVSIFEAPAYPRVAIPPHSLPQLTSEKPARPNQPSCPLHLGVGGLLQLATSGQDLWSSPARRPADGAAPHQQRSVLRQQLPGSCVPSCSNTTALFAAGSSFSGEDAASEVRTLNKRCHSVGLQVVAITSDMGSGNRAMWKQFGVHAGRYSRTVNMIPHPQYLKASKAGSYELDYASFYLADLADLDVQPAVPTNIFLEEAEHSMSQPEENSFDYCCGLIPDLMHARGIPDGLSARMAAESQCVQLPDCHEIKMKLIRRFCHAPLQLFLREKKSQVGSWGS
ncbi:hypothetical protein HPB47_019412 [Ixodes persulcatus]|uniref:Uncharacterized protein n=1 Tax=Ixodes persulcatus TaxID=34615 RepID=A0AC60QI76_IXOPE|nr:hypothetical protein HPB47_019412 [Ixodes persulcatus]